MAEFGFNQGKSFKGVDQRLADVLSLATVSYNNPAISKVSIKSGYREGDKRQHGKGAAVDVTLYDAKGKAIPDYQSPEHFNIYEDFAKHVRAVQQQLHPELDNSLRWGGYFSGNLGQKYGAMDLMHFDLAGDKIGMAAGSWDTGLHDKWKQAWKIPAAAIDAGKKAVQAATARPEGLTDKQRIVFNQISEALDQEGFSPVSKAAVLANINHESGFNPLATNNNGERSFGLFQWNGDRQDAMRAFATAQGLSAEDPLAQLQFFLHELDTSEKKAGDIIRSATTLAEANGGMRAFERYGNGDTEEAKRLATAVSFMGGDFDAVGGQPSPFGKPDAPTKPDQPKNITKLGYANPLLDEYGNPRIATALRNMFTKAGQGIKDIFTPDTEKFPEVPVLPVVAPKLPGVQVPETAPVPDDRLLPSTAPLPSQAPRGQFEGITSDDLKPDARAVQPAGAFAGVTSDDLKPDSRAKLLSALLPDVAPVPTAKPASTNPTDAYGKPFTAPKPAGTGGTAGQKFPMIRLLQSLFG